MAKIKSTTTVFNKYLDLSPLNGTHRGTVRCPCHRDRTPSLSIDLKKGLFHCFGCGIKGRGPSKLRALIAKHRPNGQGGGGTPHTKGNQPKTFKQGPDLSLAELATAKKLPESFLLSLGLKDAPYYTPPAVSIAYRNLDGDEQAVRYRLALSGPERFKWRNGSKPIFYGLDRYREIKHAGEVLLVEGESDCWTAWHHGIPALGIPGKELWHACWARCPSEVRELLTKVRVYLWHERDATKLPGIVGETLPNLHVVIPPRDIKDLSDVHLRVDQKTASAVRTLKGRALTLDVWRQRAEAAAAKMRRQDAKARAATLYQQGKSVLQAPDPLALVLKELRRQRYGGDLRLPALIYLAVTSRLLALDKAAMPVHTLLAGPPGGGKSFILKVTRSLFPSECWYEISAGSPKVLIYDDDDIRHRAIIYAEADSLPSSEKDDNPAASAVRSLLQDGELKYKVTVKDSDTGGHRVKNIERPGPSVLITTSTRKLPPQMDSRVFTLDVPDDPAQIKAALEAQAATELEGRPEPDVALVAFQGYLQAKAPWSVVVPFADALQSELPSLPI